MLGLAKHALASALPPGPSESLRPSQTHHSPGLVTHQAPLVPSLNHVWVAVWTPGFERDSALSELGSRFAVRIVSLGNLLHYARTDRTSGQQGSENTVVFLADFAMDTTGHSAACHCSALVVESGRG